MTRLKEVGVIRSGISTGKKRKNDTHESSTDPESRLYRKGRGKEARFYYMGHVLMENRHGLVVDGDLTEASGTAEAGHRR